MSQALMVTAGLLLVTTLSFDLAHEAAVNYLKNAISGGFGGEDSPSVQELEMPVDPQLEEAMKELDILFGTYDDEGSDEDTDQQDLFD